MTDRNTVVVELSQSEAFALAKFIELGRDFIEQQLERDLESQTSCRPETRTVLLTGWTAADKFAAALEDDTARCVSVDALVDLRELIQSNQTKEAHWLLTRMIHD
jgi:hypothetical protein